MRDMRALEVMLTRGLTQLPTYLSQIATPLKAGAWEELLREMPDHECAEYLLRGLN